MPRISSVHGYLDWRLAGDGAVEIVDIAVTTDRGQGHGTALMQKLLGRHGITYVYAFCRAANEAAHRFYLRNEFRLTAYLDGFYADDAAVMFGRRVCE